MIRKNQQLNAVIGNHGFKTPGVMTPETYFSWLGLNPMTQQEFLKALKRQFKPGVIRRFQQAALQQDDSQMHKVLSSDHQLLRLVNCLQFQNLCAKARLFERMPISCMA